MPRTGAFVVAITLLALPACFDSTQPMSADSSLMVANATLGVIDVTIDGRPMTFGGLSMNALSNIYTMSAGLHRVRLGLWSSPTTEITIETKRDTQLTLVVYPSGSAGVSGPATAVLVDTGAWVPSGRSLLRVANLAADNRALEIWQSEPGSSSGSRITSLFPSPSTSPYQQSDPGVWEVWTTEAGSASKTASSGPIEIPNAERRTVLLLDSPAGPRFVVIAD
jgi:hypothetical protein